VINKSLLKGLESWKLTPTTEFWTKIMSCIRVLNFDNGQGCIGSGNKIGIGVSNAFMREVFDVTNHVGFESIPRSTMLVIRMYIRYMKILRGILKYYEYCSIDLTAVIWYSELL
jgi:hypothetical protein